MFLLKVAVTLLVLFHSQTANADCLEDDQAIIHKPCKHYNDKELLYTHYKAKLESALESARISHPVKKAWGESVNVVDVEAVAPPRVLNEIEARVLIAYGRATLQGFKMNDTDALGDQLVEPLFYFLSKAYEKLQRYGRNTTDILFFVKTDGSGYTTCWPRWPTKVTQPEIAYKDKMRALLLAGEKGTIYQIKPLGAVNFGYYLSGKDKEVSPRYLLMPCSWYMVKDREVKDRRSYVYLEEMDPNGASFLHSHFFLVLLVLMLNLSTKD